MSEFKSCKDALAYVQKHLVVQKTRNNTFGNYKYRNAEDILESLKKVMPEGASVIMSDDIKSVGDRFYVISTVTFRYKDDSIQTTGCAREPFEKKKFDDSQLTGQASSYARKYALCGLFLIDDGNDSDSHDNREYRPSNSAKKVMAPVHKSQANHISPHKKFSEDLLAAGATKELIVRVLQLYGRQKLAELRVDEFEDFFSLVIGKMNDKESAIHSEDWSS